MLHRLIMFFKRFVPRLRPNPHLVRHTLEQRQRRIAEQLGRLSGRTADAELAAAYRRADRIPAKR